MIDGMINSFDAIEEDNPLIRELDLKNVYSNRDIKIYKVK